MVLSFVRAAECGAALFPMVESYVAFTMSGNTIVAMEMKNRR
ncbi:hypothetical protein [Streptomyces chilikensis]|nr:hypothetical protein [Streptomyces chilikensis]